MKPRTCDMCSYERGKTPHAKNCPRRPENASRVSEARGDYRRSTPVSPDDPRIARIAEIVTSYRDRALELSECDTYERGVRHGTLAMVVDIFRAIAIPCGRDVCTTCMGKQEVSYGTKDGLKWRPCPVCRPPEAA